MAAPPPNPAQLTLRTEKIKFYSAIVALIATVIGAIAAVLPARHAASTAKSNADASQAQVESLGQQNANLKAQLNQARATIAGLQTVDASSSSTTGVASGSSSTTYLSDMDVVYGRYRQFVSKDDLTFVGFATGVLQSGGQSFDHSVYHGDLDTNQPAYIEYNLGKKYSTLTFAGAIADAAPENAQVRFEVSVDGRLAKQFEVKFGRPQPQSTNVSGALRLRLYLVRLDPGDTHYDVGVADAVLTG